MVTVLRATGLRVIIYVNDHLPAHGHLTGKGAAKINLTGAKGSPDLVWADGMSRADIRVPWRWSRNTATTCWHNGGKSMDDLSDFKIDQALERGLQARETQPRARRAVYDRNLGLIVVDLTNGCSVTFPTSLVQGLESASADQVAEVEVQGQG